MSVKNSGMTTGVRRALETSSAFSVWEELLPAHELMDPPYAKLA